MAYLRDLFVYTHKGFMVLIKHLLNNYKSLSKSIKSVFEQQNILDSLVRFRLDCYLVDVFDHLYNETYHLSFDRKTIHGHLIMIYGCISFMELFLENPLPYFICGTNIFFIKI